MAATTSTSHEEQSPAPAGAFADAGFADSGIMDMTTPTLSPQSKPQFETDLSESVEDGAYDHLVDYSTEAVLSDSDPATVSEFEPDPELISHLTTTVSSLRLRGQEQLHIYALFTSKIEALAQRSLQHEATIRDLTSQLQSIRESNTTLGRENAMLAHENNDLRVTMQDLKGDVVEREIAMEAMTGAVRGLEGWIESANNSPRSNSQLPVYSDRVGNRMARKDVFKGKGRFRGRYRLDREGGSGIRDVHGIHESVDAEPTEIQEGVMAWVRGFKDVEEGLRARQEMDGQDKDSGHVNGRHAGNKRSHDEHNNQDNDTIDTFDEDFGEFETG